MKAVVVHLYLDGSISNTWLFRKTKINMLQLELRRNIINKLFVKTIKHKVRTYNG